MMSGKQALYRNNIFILIIMFVAAVLLWNTVLLYPVKLFVVALHELSHGVAAVLMGGRIENIQISPQIGGYCQYSFPASAGVLKKTFVASAGYLGSMLWGAVILMLASISRMDRRITFSIGVMMLILTYWVVKTGELFGILFCLIFGLFLLISAKILPDRFHDLFLKFLGLASCLYVIIDIKDDLIVYQACGNDAHAIAQLLGIPQMAIIIGIAWIFLALVILFLALRFAFRHQEE